jgi:hypothetical protein
VSIAPGLASGQDSNRYANADLPDAMTFLSGRTVKTALDWEARKAEIKRLWCDYYLGHYPQQTPALLSAKVVSSTPGADGSNRKRIVLTFDTPNQKSFEIEVWEPTPAEKQARPLLLTQARNYQREKVGPSSFAARLRRLHLSGAGCAPPGTGLSRLSKRLEDIQT